MTKVREKIVVLKENLKADSLLTENKSFQSL